MARVIVILTLLFLITGAIFGLTRKPAGYNSGIGADAGTTLPLAADEVAEKRPSAAGDPEAPLATAQDLVTGLVAGAAPAFSSVGVDHRGRASFTGTASPGDRVSVVRGSKVLGRAFAGRDGSWTIEFRVPQAREPYELKVEALRSGGEVVAGPQWAIVSAPESSGGLPRITLAGLEQSATETSPTKPEAATPATTEAAQPDVGIIIEKVVVDAKGAASLRGKADAGGTIKVQLGGKDVASTKVATNGVWSLIVTNTSAAAVKSARVVLQSASGQELDFSEFPLALPAAAVVPVELPVASKVASQSSAAMPPALSGTFKPKRERGYFVKVRRGDSLWKLAKRHYGDGRKWTKIMKANSKRLGDPDVIRPGRRLYLP